LFVQSVEEYAEFAASVLRRAMARVFAVGGPPPGGLPVAIVAAPSPVHSSGFAAAVARGYPVRMISAPATMAIGEIVRRLNDAQPPVLLAHASTLALLASEQRAGRLRISPRAITGMSELLTDQARIAIGDSFAVRPSTSSSRPKAWSDTATPEEAHSASPLTCASSSSSTRTTSLLPTGLAPPRF
jgi:phenylacetate-CoA ligase